MLRFLEVAHMVAATQDVMSGGGGVMLAFLEVASMVAATQDVWWGGGWGDVSVP